jgi:aspartyl-tRNA(Asn)/glutamyl-tRNA(Gln) amidotransferase subunit C
MVFARPAACVLQRPESLLPRPRQTMTDSRETVDVDHIATLARLSLTADERARFAREISAIVDYVAQLAEADVGDAEPMAHATAIDNVVRADAAGETLSQDAVLDNAPAVLDDELIRVPAVIGDDGGSS